VWNLKNSGSVGEQTRRSWEESLGEGKRNLEFQISAQKGLQEDIEKRNIRKGKVGSLNC